MEKTANVNRPQQNKEQHDDNEKEFEMDLVKFDAEFSATLQWGGERVQILAPKCKEFLDS